MSRRLVGQHHVDQRRRQEGVGDPVPLDVLEEPADVGCTHHHHLAARREHREAEHTGGVGERGEREVDRAALPRVAHQGDRGHRLQVGAGEPHPLGTPRRAARADDRGQVAERRLVHDTRAGVEERVPPERPGELPVEADQCPQLGQVVLDLLDEGRERGLEDQQPAPDEGEEVAVLGRLVARVQRAPHRPGAADAEERGERDRVVGRQDGHGVTGGHALGGQAGRDAEAELPHLVVRAGAVRGGEARRSRPDRPALVEVVHQAHGVSLPRSGPARRPVRRSAAPRAARGDRTPGSPTRTRPAAAAAGAARRRRRPGAGRSACSSGSRG